MVNSTLNKGEGGRYAVTARLIGVNDDAGNVVTLTQNAERDARGVRQAARRRRCEPAVKSLADAKALHRAAHRQARQGGRAGQQGASRRCPNHGLAEYCLALLAQDKKAPREEVVKHLQASPRATR